MSRKPQRCRRLSAGPKVVACVRSVGRSGPGMAPTLAVLLALLVIASPTPTARFPTHDEAGGWVADGSAHSLWRTRRGTSTEAGADVSPYHPGHHGSRLNHSEVRERLRIRRGTPDTVEGVGRSGSRAWSVNDPQPVLRQINLNTHVITVPDPLRYVSFHEPSGPGGCSDGVDRRATVSTTAAAHECIFAVNAGFFNTTSGACYGNLVSDGALVQTSEWQNVHLGVREDGSLLAGYITAAMAAGINTTQAPFAQLIGGAVWLVGGPTAVLLFVWLPGASVDVHPLFTVGAQRYKLRHRIHRHRVGGSGGDGDHVPVCQHQGSPHRDRVYRRRDHEDRAS